MTQRPAPMLSGGAPGKTNREIKRCLVRHVARQLFRLLEREAGSRFVV